MRLSRRAVLAVGGALGLTGQITVDESDEDDIENNSSESSGLYGTGYYNEGIYHNPSALYGDEDEEVDE